MAEQDREVIRQRIEEGLERERRESRRQMKKRLRQEARGFHSDFRKFITRGNVVDLAVAVVIGQAFNKIVNGIVSYIIAPCISFFVGGISMADWKWCLKPATEDSAEIAIQYGSLIQAMFDFFLIAFCIFVALRVIRRIKRKLNEKELAAQAAAEAEKKAKAEKQAAAEKRAAEEKEATVAGFYADAREQKELLREIRDLMTEKAK